jgi:hypothetical protein
LVRDSEEQKKLLDELYGKAQHLMHPEATTHMAIMLHDKIIQRLSAESTGKIPANCKLTPCRQDLYDIWNLLAQACVQGNDFKEMVCK